MKKKVVTVKPNQDLFDLSRQNEVYRSGYILEGMNVEEQQIEFSGGLKVTKGVDNSLLKDEHSKKCKFAELLKSIYAKKNS